MLRTVQDLQRCSIVDKEGEVGSLCDVLFDNRRWVPRWFVLERWAAGSHVLVSPALVNNIDWGALSIEVDLTRDHIHNPENLETSRHPPSRHFGNKRVGGGAQRPELYALLGGFRAARDRVAGRGQPRDVNAKGHYQDRRHAIGAAGPQQLNDVKGLRVQAIDGDVGHVADLILDESWVVRYVIVAGNGIGVQGVVVAVGWIQKIDWGISKVYLDMTKPQIYSSPKYRSQVVLRHG